MPLWLKPINQTFLLKKGLILNTSPVSIETVSLHNTAPCNKWMIKSPYPIYANLCVPVAICEVWFRIRCWTESTDTITHSFLCAVRIISTLISPQFEITLCSTARALARTRNKQKTLDVKKTHELFQKNSSSWHIHKVSIFLICTK